MKNKLIFIVLFFILLSFLSCGEDGKENAENDSESSNDEDIYEEEDLCGTVDEKCKAGEIKSCVEMNSEIFSDGTAECKDDCSGYNFAGCSVVSGKFDSGTFHVCNISEGKLFCWGNNYYGQLGDGTNIDKNIPVQIGKESDWSFVSAGNNFTCGIRNGELYCWGDNEYGQLGDGTQEKSNKPIKVDDKKDWTKISSGYYHSCGIRSGKVYCWGNINSLFDKEVTVPFQIGEHDDWE
ncbi:MAG TPA: RCC1 domain-containing protein, partial [bacterium]|nr:RCC1 domain-containing protein [bacterium]